MTYRLIIALLCGALCCPVAGATDIQKLIQETQRLNMDGNDMALVWWLPTDFWRASLEAQHLDASAGKPLIAAVDDYLVFIVVKASVSGTTIVAARTRDEIAVSSRLVIDGKTIDPLPPDSVGPIASAVLSKLKPMMAQMLGPFGQSIELIIYPAKVGDHRLLDTTQPGSFSYTLYDKTYRWRLPLASTLPARVDAKTGEEFPGSYLFNPYTGDRLGGT